MIDLSRALVGVFVCFLFASVGTPDAGAQQDDGLFLWAGTPLALIDDAVVEEPGRYWVSEESQPAPYPSYSLTQVGLAPTVVLGGEVFFLVPRPDPLVREAGIAYFDLLGFSALEAMGSQVVLSATGVLSGIVGTPSFQVRFFSRDSVGFDLADRFVSEAVREFGQSVRANKCRTFDCPGPAVKRVTVYVSRLAGESWSDFCRAAMARARRKAVEACED